MCFEADNFSLVGGFIFTIFLAGTALRRGLAQVSRHFTLPFPGKYN